MQYQAMSETSYKIFTVHYHLCLTHYSHAPSERAIVEIVKM